jgi:hypothetical protein
MITKQLFRDSSVVAEDSFHFYFFFDFIFICNFVFIYQSSSSHQSGKIRDQGVVALGRLPQGSNPLYLIKGEFSPLQSSASLHAPLSQSSNP